MLGFEPAETGEAIERMCKKGFWPLFEKYDVGPVLPAEGYSDAQLGELEQAIAATPCEALVIGTPMDLRHLIRLTKPVARATYRLQELDGSGLTEVLERFIARTSPVSVG